MRRRTLLGVIAVAVLGAACAQRPPVGSPAASPSTEPATEAAPNDPAPTPTGAAAWQHLAMVTDFLDEGAAAVAVEDARALAKAWRRYDFDVAAPQIEFDRRFVLLVLQPDDACPDEVIGLDVEDRRLHVEWLAPPGGCIQPLIHRVHAIAVHRGYVPPEFDVVIAEPYADSAAPTTITLQPYDGPAAPPPSQPPQAMTEAEVDAVFAGHAVRRCTPKDEVVPPLPAGAVVDERNEVEEEASMQAVIDWLRANGWDLEREVLPIMDRRENLRPQLRVDADRVKRLQRQVDAEFGKGTVVVDANRYRMADIAAAQQALQPLMGGEGPGSIWSSTGLPGPVKLSMVDPTREALDAIAATVDPSLVCVDVELSGVPRRGGG